MKTCLGFLIFVLVVFDLCHAIPASYNGKRKSKPTIGSADTKDHGDLIPIPDKMLKKPVENVDHGNFNSILLFKLHLWFHPIFE
jgi:hypothetical protein